METVGKIFSSGPNNNDIWNTAVEQNGGDLIEVHQDGVYFTGPDTQLSFLPNLIHSFSAFNIALDIDITGPWYDLRVGLEGMQVNNNGNIHVGLTRDGNATSIRLFNNRNGYTRFQETLPLILSGLVKIRISYEALQWNILIIYNGSEYRYTYKYKRPAVTGHVTSRFSLFSFGDIAIVRKMFIDIPIIKGQTLFIGDSITWGAGRPFGSRTFTEQYNVYDERCDVFASGSANSFDIKNGLEAIKLIAPSRVILLIGDNDDYNNPQVFDDNIQDILYYMMYDFPIAGLPVPQISVCNLTPELADPGYAALRDKVNAMSFLPPHHVIDTWSPLARIDNPDLADPVNLVGHVHLSATGHNKVYQNI